MRINDEIIGKQFGRLCVESLTRIAVQHKRKRSRACAIVVCNCGTRKTIGVDDLINGKIKSCGCLRRENNRTKKSLAERFWVKVNKNGSLSSHRPDLGPCWIWIAAINAKGYGIMSVDVGSTLVHRISYKISGGVIPDGMQIDHLCRVRNCVNPKHLEVVTPRINTHRGYGPAAMRARKTHCPKEHPYSGDNLYVSPTGNRQCRICIRQNQRNYQERKKLK